MPSWHGIQGISPKAILRLRMGRYFRSIDSYFSSSYDASKEGNSNNSAG